jgi:hypothetical protein
MREPRVLEIGRLFVIHQPVPPNLEEAKAELARYGRFVTRVGPAPIMMIPEKILPPMGQDVRNLYRAVTTDPGVEAMATVIGGIVGLGASIMSSIMTQIFQGRTDIPMRTVRDVEEAVKWLAEVAELQAEPTHIVSAIEQLRAQA